MSQCIGRYACELPAEKCAEVGLFIVDDDLADFPPVAGPRLRRAHPAVCSEGAKIHGAASFYAANALLGLAVSCGSLPGVFFCLWKLARNRAWSKYSGADKARNFGICLVMAALLPELAVRRMVKRKGGLPLYRHPLRTRLRICLRPLTPSISRMGSKIASTQN